MTILYTYNISYIVQQSRFGRFVFVQDALGSNCWTPDCAGQIVHYDQFNESLEIVCTRAKNKESVAEGKAKKTKAAKTRAEPYRPKKKLRKDSEHGLADTKKDDEDGGDEEVSYRRWQ
jgi:hypothetical protein